MTEQTLYERIGGVNAIAMVVVHVAASGAAIRAPMSQTLSRFHMSIAPNRRAINDFQLCARHRSSQASPLTSETGLPFAVELMRLLWEAEE